MIWKTRRADLEIGSRSVVMGIINATPDSFSDGGRFDHVEAAVAHAMELVDQGAEILDIGGESTRPGAEAVSARKETARTVPVIEAIRKKSEVLLSIDTSKAEVAQAAIDAGADIVNDVTGLTGDPQMAPVCASSGVGVVVMHMQGTPRNMQKNPDYSKSGGVVQAVKDFFQRRKEELINQGINPQCLCFDPGIGFGKTLEHNLELLRNLSEFTKEHLIVLGVSRKSFLGALTGIENPSNRDAATSAVSVMAHLAGVRLHRVHDVAINVQALRVTEACH